MIEVERASSTRSLLISCSFLFLFYLSNFDDPLRTLISGGWSIGILTRTWILTKLQRKNSKTRFLTRPRLSTGLHSDNSALLQEALENDG